MSFTVSHRLQRVKPSATLAMSSQAMQLQKQGNDVINLSVGEPDFDTPEFIQQAAIAAMQKGQTRYTPVAGTVELRQAIIHKFKQDHNLEYELSQIVVTNGAKQALFNALQAILNPGDEIIIPAPYWVSYGDMAELCEAKPVIIQGRFENHFKITAEQLAEAITPKTKVVLFNAPANPTGVTYTQQDWLAFAEVLKRHPDILIINDDIYEKVYWANVPLANFLKTCPDLYDRSIMINGVSKTYAMTGWRIGYAAGPKKLIQAMSDLQSHSTSNACSISQAAALAALSGDQSCLVPMVKAFHERHDQALAALKRIHGVECLAADGAFYLFPRIQAAIAHLGLSSDLEFAEKLLAEKFVATVPGSAFGTPGYIRISTALAMDKLLQAIERIQSFIEK